MTEVPMTIRRWGDTALYVIGPNVTQYDYFKVQVDSHAIWITLYREPQPGTNTNWWFHHKRLKRGIRKLSKTTKGVVLFHINLDKFEEEGDSFQVPTFGTRSKRDVPLYRIRA